MEIIKSTSTLGFVLLVLTSTNVASAQDDSYWWAIAVNAYSNKNSSEPVTYGAAWNSASREEAKKAALGACEERNASSWDCFSAAEGNNSCFAIIRLDIHHKSRGSYTSFDLYPKSGTHYRSRAQAQAEVQAEREAHHAYYDNAAMSGVSNQPSSYLSALELIDASAHRHSGSAERATPRAWWVLSPVRSLRSTAASDPGCTVGCQALASAARPGVRDVCVRDVRSRIRRFATGAKACADQPPTSAPSRAGASIWRAAGLLL